VRPELRQDQKGQLKGLEVTIHRGAAQVGGSCIEVSTGSTRLILDVGLPLDQPEALSGRPSRSRAVQPLPAVPGLFYAGPRVHGVLLSHAHGDHAGLIENIGNDIPIFCSQGTSKMLLAGSIFAGQPKLDRSRSRLLEHRKPRRIGDLTVTAFPVDHSAFDSVALLLEAEGKRLLYSGDLRLHGRKPGMARELIRHVQANPVDVLLMEGTNITRSGAGLQHTEDGLVEQLVLHMQDSSGLVLANFSPQHVDRLVSFYKAARRADRTFVVDVYGAFVLHLVSGQCRIPRPSKRSGIQVYYNAAFNRSWRQRGLKKIHDLFLSSRVELTAIREDPARYAMLFRPSMCNLDFHDVLPRSTTCIYSYWPGYLVQPEYAALQAKLTKVQGNFVQCHTSGHIFRDDIVTFVQAINPRWVVPIHTASPKSFAALFSNVKQPADGETVNV